MDDRSDEADHQVWRYAQADWLRLSMLPRPSRRLLLLVAMTFCAMHGSSVLAAPDEIAVYADEINDPGKFGWEQHLNYSIAGNQMPQYPGQMAPHHVVQATSEITYGIANNFEAGIYLPVAFAPDGDSFVNGLRLRLRYIAPKTEGNPVFYGLNVELNRNSIRVAESASGIELRPIIGYRDAQWLLSFNPILNAGLSDTANQQVQFEPALKLTRRVTEDAHCGVEYYGAYGVLDKMLPADRIGHTLYAVLDTETQGFDINVGLGRGYANTSDEWLAKGVIAFPL